MSAAFRAGILILALLSLGDVAGPLLTDGQHPPMEIALIGSAAGVISLVLAVLAWRTHKIGYVVGLVAIRVLSALTAVPAFQVPEVPVAAKMLAGILLTLTVVGVALTLVGLRRPVAVRA